VPRIREITHEAATAEQLAALEGDVARRGEVMNTTRIYAHEPSLMPPLRALHDALAETPIPEDLVSLVRLHVAKINGCKF
jgi:alkylhydroperoxidase family enzyme